MQIFLSESPEQTEKFAAEFAETLMPFDVIAFRGELGAGKTCFMRGLARGLGCTDAVTSPTFALMNEYRGGRLKVFHFDMYRISSWEDLDAIGFFDACDSGGVVAVEWSENIENALPENRIEITVAKTGENAREFTVDRRKKP